MRILIVDDNEPNLYLLESLLKGSGYKVDSARDGVEALEKLSHAGFDMIISDILMPRMDGYRLCREVKTDPRLRWTAFIFYTATYTDPKDEKFALGLGADKFIIKPAEPDKFIATIQEVVRDGASVSWGLPRVPEESPNYLKEYNERLIGKLEDKMLQVQEARVKLTVKESHLRQIIETEPEQVKVLDPDRKLVDINASGLRMLEAESLEQVQGKPFDLFVIPELRPDFVALAERVFLGESGSLDLEIVGLKGARLWLETRAAPLRNERGEIFAMLGISRDLTERKEGERKLQESLTQLRALSAGILRAREEEDKKIARELHDESGQLLAAIRISLNAVMSELPAKSQEKLKEVERHLADMEGRLRDLTHELRPTILDHLGLLPALQSLARRVARRSGIVISVESTTAERFPPAIETGLYRIVQEGLNNIEKHSGAKSAEIRLDRESDTVRCSVIDTGIGFDVSSVLSKSNFGGLGLIGIRERLYELQGELQIDSSPSAGTTLIATIPLAKRNDKEG